MDNVLRIRPSLGEVRYQGLAIPVADIELGGVPRGAALILCEQGELSSTADEIGNRFAEHGYESTTADLVTLLGPGSADDAIAGALQVLLRHVSRRDWTTDQIGVLGYGQSGRASLIAAARFPVGAAVSAAARLEDVVNGLSPYSFSLAVPWLGMFAADAATEASRVRSFGDAVDAASKAFTTVLGYTQAGRSFYRDSREPWEQAAAFDSWQRTVEWFNLRVVPRPTPLAQAWRARQGAA